MAGKEILFGFDARQRIGVGVEKLASAVQVTLGPCGRNVVLGKQFESAVITKDGATVSKAIHLNDPFEEIGAQMINEVAHKTANVSGDGTTTATVLAKSIFYEGNKYVVSGANPMELKRGIDMAVKNAIDYINERAISVSGIEDMIQIATISANGDRIIGAQIAKAVYTVGKDGVVTVEEAQGVESSTDVVKGMNFENGSVSPYLFNEKTSRKSELSDPNILLYDKRISTIKPLLPILEKSARSGKPLLIIAEDICGDALTTLVVNKMRGSLNVMAIKAPGFGDRQKRILSDIAILTGGKLISEDIGRTLESVVEDDFGSAKKVVVKSDSTVIVDGMGRGEDIELRINTLKAQVEFSESDYDKEKLKERIAKLSGGVAVIKIGAVSETEMKEKKDRAEDALHATRAAVECGVVPGGGLSLLKAADYIAKDKPSGDEGLGYQIVLKALEEPLRLIVENAGFEGSVIINAIEGFDDDVTGFNASTGEFVNMLEDGIKDPVKVVTIALQNAASIAGLLLTTECVIAEESNDEKNTFSPGAPGMGLPPRF
jgi:chaperonin GroEL